MTLTPRRHLGFSLVEMMVALTVGLFLVGGMIAVLLTSASGSRTRERASDVQTNGRYAMEMIKRDLQHSGFYGYTAIVANEPFTTVPGNACDAATFGNLAKRVYAMDSNVGDVDYTRCIPNDNYSKGDVLMVRHLSATPLAAGAAWESGVIYYRSAYEGGTMYVGNTAPDFSANKWTTAFDYQYEEAAYYINKYTDTAGDNVPALYRVRLTSGPTMTRELVASGVEDMRIRARKNIGVNPPTSSWTTTGSMNIVDWDSVTAVEVSILARGSAPETGYVNPTSYRLGGEDVPVAQDGYRRQVFSTIVYIRN